VPLALVMGEPGRPDVLLRVPRPRCGLLLYLRQILPYPSLRRARATAHLLAARTRQCRAWGPHSSLKPTSTTPPSSTNAANLCITARAPQCSTTWSLTTLTSLTTSERQFHHLVRTVPSSGRVVVNGLEESLARVVHAGCWSELRSFGAAVSDFSAVGEPHDFEVLQNGKPVARVRWGLNGVHNQLNALAAIAAAEHVGVSPADAAKALGEFQNVKRRMEVRGTVGGVTVLDDFAHHPTAIRTTVDGLRRQVDSARILAVFEPRSNTMKLGTMKSQLPWSLEQADLAFCHSGGLGWDATEALAPMEARCVVADNIATLVDAVISAAQPGDHILCMSNGGFGGIHQKLLDALSKK
jgi:UDP-N-acetylmuramate: L-alanyl-gamma-D-glutamyl-meso-diaminopimelate ligase